MLHAFIDETRKQHGSVPMFGLSAILFEQHNLAPFEAEWSARCAGLKKPFHAAYCNANRDEYAAFGSAANRQLAADLAKIIGRYRSYAFVCLLDQPEYDAWSAAHPSRVSAVGSPYAVCLVNILDMIKGVLDRAGDHREVWYGIESGGNGWNEAQDIFDRILRLNKGQFKTKLQIKTYTQLGKTDSVHLCAADFLIWEWQRHFYEDEKGTGGDEYRQNFKDLFSGEAASGIFHRYIDKGRINNRALFNRINKIDRDY
ncbi:hypothetical protein [Ferrovibrio sp.]|uniref:hypothetical protein n=1 Tax=Ferrovibrio sp. TaxID=1917215 RepID=UPI0026314C3F|nr:hypothetical protein [Ferrovibrio sp.]